MSNNMVRISQFLKKQRPIIRGIFNGVCVVLLLVFVYFKQEEIYEKTFISNHNSPFFNIFQPKDSLDQNARDVEALRRTMGETSESLLNSLSEIEEEVSSCTGIYEFEGYDSKCEFLKANPQCNSEGYFNYVKFFYCDCEKYTAIGYVGLGIWLVALFYLLGNTASDYFCCSLEKLSYLLKLPPTVAGVTLLPLGNGAPDVFASIAAFVGNDSGDVGLNGVLGGAVFVTCVVVGTVSLCVAELNVRIDKKCFIRDVLFFVWTLLSLGAILFVGEIGVWGAIAFVSIYGVYAFYVAASMLLKKRAKVLRIEAPLTPYNSPENETLLSLLESGCDDEASHLQEKLPHWMWSSHVAIYSNEMVKPSSENDQIPLWGWNEEPEIENSGPSCSDLCSWLELPLALPRKLTIPVVEEDRWSKVYAVLSVLLAPLLLAFLWNTQDDSEYISEELVYIISIITGFILGMLAYLFTSIDHPPRSYVLPWVIGGFFMSIVWFYIVANELVALLVSFGLIIGIDPALLSLTVLAWGNSMGDLMSNVSMAMSGGDGVQIAMSGCYAGPMFNTLAGLGISMLIGAWSGRPNSYIIPEDNSLYFTLGFLIFSLLWALFILPRNDMRPNKLLGVGLMVIYVVFLSLRATVAIF
ncbi:primary active transporter [Lithospermum erythrorhizon]|uniref:Primary active transporter n=1 Tax=Lithospermum erythrorhizon TaxID=34254 RepID=A0AAV3QQK7_LITER